MIPATVYVLKMWTYPLGTPLPQTTVLLFGLVWLVSFAAAMTLVFPIMFVLPSTRRPTWWLAGVWGAAIGLIVVAVLERRSVLHNVVALASFASMGALAGMTYAVLARRRPDADQP